MGNSNRELIARLMAGIETPDDLTTEEQEEHRQDLLLFLQGEYDRASFKCPDPNGPDCHDDRCALHYGEDSGGAQAELRAERDRLVAALDACGGRNIEIAEQIDEIDRELGESEFDDLTRTEQEAQR